MLRRAGLALTATMLPATKGVPQESGAVLHAAKTRADYPISDAMRQLSTYMSQARARALPGAAIDAKRHILDSFAAVVSGSELPAGRVARAYGGNSVATIVADKHASARSKRHL
jgi:hypothetical protein